MRCITHVSYSRDPGLHNETLEFLGDSVLNLAISDLLMQHFPHRTEGDLSRMRASLVNGKTLAQKSKQLGAGSLLRIGKGEERSGGRTKPSILAAVLEALLGGIFCEAGYPAAHRVVQKHFEQDIKQERLGLDDYKTRLQELSQLLYREPPSYAVVAESGPSHAKRFVTEISVGGHIVGRGEGRSKKQSEQQAAKQALEELRQGGG